MGIIKNLRLRHKYLIRFLRASHVFIFFYYFIALFLAVFGILSRYPLLNNLTFFFMIGIFSSQFAISCIYYEEYKRTLCPLTLFEHKLLKRYLPEIKYKGIISDITKKLTFGKIRIGGKMLIFLEFLVFTAIAVSFFAY